VRPRDADDQAGEGRKQDRERDVALPARKAVDEVREQSGRGPALGVPITPSPERLALTRFRVPAGQSLGKQSRTPQNPDNKPDDPWPIDHPYETQKYQPWSTANAYAHTLVSGNDGALIASDVTFRFGSDPAPHSRSH